MVLKRIDSAYAILLDHSGRVALHKRADTNLYFLPGDRLSLTESSAETAVTACRVQIGVEMDPRLFDKAGHYHLSEKVESRHPEVQFFARTFKFSPNLCLNGDTSAHVGWFFMNQILKMHTNGTIAPGQLRAILFYKLCLQQKRQKKKQDPLPYHRCLKDPFEGRVCDVRWHV